MFNRLRLNRLSPIFQPCRYTLFRMFNGNYIGAHIIVSDFSSTINRLDATYIVIAHRAIFLRGRILHFRTLMISIGDSTNGRVRYRCTGRGTQDLTHFPTFRIVAEIDLGIVVTNI